MLIISFLLSSIFFTNRKKLINYNVVYDLFKVIKNAGSVFFKIMLLMLVFIFINYFSYVYFGAGLSMGYGLIMVVSMLLLVVLWGLSFTNMWKTTIGHSVPLGVQGLSKIFTPLIEILGVIIRPLTLATRLATNISCGHVVLLMFSYFMISLSMSVFVNISILSLILLVIEFLVCVIQAYVFWSLLFIYLSDLEV